MTEAAVEPTTDAPRWGLGDALGGWIGIQVWGLLFGAAVLSITGHAGEDYDTIPLAVVALAQIGLSIGMWGVPALAAHVKGTSLAADFGFRIRWSDIPLGLATGFLLQVVGLRLLYLPIFELLDKTSSDLDGPARSLSDRAEGATGVVLLILIVGILAPIFEELFYRGLMQRAFLKRGLPPWAAITVTAGIFGLSHGEMLQLPGLVAAGLLFGYLAHRTGRLGASITCHLAFNMVATIALLVR
jgi:membrane protease YdiL (CAAX protease family)